MYDTLPPVLGESEPVTTLLDQASRIAPLSRPVLIVGERGTGKELIAARVHYLSRRWQRSYEKVNCAALPESLLDAELFGHEAGAFTGALRRRAGAFERADGGSLMLDEIATLSPIAQEKLLRVSEYGELRRLGAAETLRVDVRIIGATHADLPEMARRGDFRHDLLDRLSFDVLTVPPLRARGEDIRLLAEHFARDMAVELEHEKFAGFTPNASATLCNHTWPGNVRELKNAVERAVYKLPLPGLPVDEIELDPFASPYAPHLADPADSQARPVTPPVVTEDLRRSVAQYEAALIRDALARHHFNQRATAKALKLGYHQLRNRLRKYDLLARSPE